MIAVVDYGMGNLRSVQKGFESAGVDGVSITGYPPAIVDADGIVLPGVGAFRDAVAHLEASGIRDALLAAIASGTPLLGICLGMQMLAETGFEDGEWSGLGVIPGTCVRLPDVVKVPHMGWNTVDYPRPSPLFDGIPAGSAFYFVHSYRLNPAQDSCIIGKTEHGLSFASAIQASPNVFAVQFHPEKSSAAGLRLLANFGRIVQEKKQ